MKTIAFVLTMPNVGSWNGKWSGEGRLYAVLERMTDKKADKLLEKPSHHYSFTDGWGANVAIKEITDRAEARTMRRHTKGFCGYEWMIRSIKNLGTIKATHER